jgi:hypothetical protein
MLLKHLTTGNWVEAKSILLQKNSLDLKNSEEFFEFALFDVVNPPLEINLLLFFRFICRNQKEAVETSILCLNTLAQSEIEYEEIYNVIERSKVHRRTCGNWLTPLMFATKSNFPVILIEMLFKAGANVHDRVASGFNALLLAADNNVNPAIIKLLLQHGANPNSCTFKTSQSPIMIAAYKNASVEIATILLQGGGNVNHLSSDGFTPLYVATQCNCLELQKLFIQHGALVNFKSTVGYTLVFF